MNYYLFKLIKKGQFNPFLSFRSSYNIQGSGGSRVVNYVPIGINFLGSKKFYQVSTLDQHILFNSYPMDHIECSNQIIQSTYFMSMEDLK